MSFPVPSVFTRNICHCLYLRISQIKKSANRFISDIRFEVINTSSLKLRVTLLVRGRTLMKFAIEDSFHLSLTTFTVSVM